MARKGKDKVADSAEYQAFENLAKQVLSVPKSELNRREKEAKQSKPKQQGS